jgi:hypothetical protein
LYHNGVINLDDERGGFVLLTGEDKGFYLFYDRKKSEAIAGVVIKGKAIGAFSHDIKEAEAIEVDVAKLKLPKESILLPAELQKRRVLKMQKEGLKNFFVTVSIFVGAFFFNLSLTSLASEKSEFKQKLQKIKFKKRQAQDDLAKLKTIRYEPKRAGKIPRTLPPLLIIAHANPEKLKIDSMSLGSRRFSFVVVEGIQPWMNGILESNLFTLTEDYKPISNFKEAISKKKNAIKIEWKGK